MGSRYLPLLLLLCGLVAVSVASAQQTPPKPRPLAPVKPYKPVAVTLPTPINDPTFDNFRRRLADVAANKDIIELKSIVVEKGFFWKTEKGEKADQNKSGFDNLAAAVQLDAPDGSGWDHLGSYAFDPTAALVPALKDVICSPADPTFNDQEMDDLLRTTQTGIEEWGYPLVSGIEVRSARQPNAPVIDKLGMYFVRVLVDEDEPNAPVGQFHMLRVALPSGKTGFLPAFVLAPLGNDQLCYRKEADGWKIAGYIGGDP
ncbi:MAG TPA: hypothetical protein VNL39_09470 [Xanthobacteraceae bacterium]|nr:hypothetical protein [Xanthobacteraceae bacterium]